MRIITREWGCFGESLSLKSYWLSDRFLPSFVKDVAAILKAYFLTHLQSLLQNLLGNNSLESECQRGWQTDLESEKKHPAVSHLLCVFSSVPSLCPINFKSNLGWERSSVGVSSQILLSHSLNWHLPCSWSIKFPCSYPRRALYLHQLTLGLGWKNIYFASLHPY